MRGWPESMNTEFEDRPLDEVDVAKMFLILVFWLVMAELVLQKG